MPHLGYVERSSKDYATWDEWVQAVNDAYRYCRALPPHRVNEWRWKCRHSQLPSFHPYWRMRVVRKEYSRGRDFAALVEMLKGSPDLIRYHFNASTGIDDLLARLKEYPKRRQAWTAPTAPCAGRQAA